MILGIRKSLLSPMPADLIFHHEQNGTWINYKILCSKQVTLEWSVFAGCFSEPKWRSVQTVWYPNGGLASLGMAVSCCNALWCWIKVSAVVHFSQLKGLFGPLLGLKHPYAILFKILKWPFCLPLAPHHPRTLELAWYGQHGVKKTI